MLSRGEIVRRRQLEALQRQKQEIAEREAARIRAGETNQTLITNSSPQRPPQHNHQPGAVSKLFTSGRPNADKNAAHGSGSNDQRLRAYEEKRRKFLAKKQLQVQKSTQNKHSIIHKPPTEQENDFFKRFAAFQAQNQTNPHERQPIAYPQPPTASTSTTQPLVSSEPLHPRFPTSHPGDPKREHDSTPAVPSMLQPSFNTALQQPPKQQVTSQPPVSMQPVQPAPRPMPASTPNAKSVHRPVSATSQAEDAKIKEKLEKRLKQAEYRAELLQQMQLKDAIALKSKKLQSSPKKKGFLDGFGQQRPQPKVASLSPNIVVDMYNPQQQHTSRVHGQVHALSAQTEASIDVNKGFYGGFTTETRQSEREREVENYRKELARQIEIQSKLQNNKNVNSKIESFDMSNGFYAGFSNAHTSQSSQQRKRNQEALKYRQELEKQIYERQTHLKPAQTNVNNFNAGLQLLRNAPDTEEMDAMKAAEMMQYRLELDRQVMQKQFEKKANNIGASTGARDQKLNPTASVDISNGFLGGFSKPNDVVKRRNENAEAYKLELQKQIEEKKRRQLLEKQKLEMEDKRLEVKLARDREEMQRQKSLEKNVTGTAAVHAQMPQTSQLPQSDVDSKRVGPYQRITDLENENELSKQQKKDQFMHELKLQAEEAKRRKEMEKRRMEEEDRKLEEKIQKDLQEMNANASEESQFMPKNEQIAGIATTRPTVHANAPSGGIDWGQNNIEFPPNQKNISRLFEPNAEKSPVRATSAKGRRSEMGAKPTLQSKQSNSSLHRSRPSTSSKLLQEMMKMKQELVDKQDKLHSELDSIKKASKSSDVTTKDTSTDMKSSSLSYNHGKFSERTNKIEQEIVKIKKELLEKQEKMRDDLLSAVAKKPDTPKKLIPQRPPERQGTTDRLASEIRELRDLVEKQQQQLLSQQKSDNFDTFNHMHQSRTSQKLLNHNDSNILNRDENKTPVSKQVSRKHQVAHDTHTEHQNDSDEFNFARIKAKLDPKQDETMPRDDFLRFNQTNIQRPGTADTTATLATFDFDSFKIDGNQSHNPLRSVGTSIAKDSLRPNSQYSISSTRLNTPMIVNDHSHEKKIFTNHLSSHVNSQVGIKKMLASPGSSRPSTSFSILAEDEALLDRAINMSPLNSTATTVELRRDVSKSGTNTIDSSTIDKDKSFESKSQWFDSNNHVPLPDLPGVIAEPTKTLRTEKVSVFDETDDINDINDSFLFQLHEKNMNRLDMLNQANLNLHTNFVSSSGSTDTQFKDSTHFALGKLANVLNKETTKQKSMYSSVQNDFGQPLSDTMSTDMQGSLKLKDFVVRY